MVQPTILITGADGQLGMEFRRLADQHPHFQFLFVGKLDLDVTVETWVMNHILEQKPDAVINCAAYTNVERAEDEPEMAMLGNCAAAGFLADACHAAGSLLVHISTDYVFDGKKKTPYKEYDHTKPLNIYGHSKWQGEKLVGEKSKRHFIIRTSWLYSTYGHNFMKTMLRLGKELNELKVVADQTASPTHAANLATDILILLNKVLVHQESVDFGVYHYSQKGEASWYDFAVEIMHQAKMNVTITAVSSDAFPVKAIRPRYSKLDHSKWEKNTGLSPIHWKEGLTECMRHPKES